MIHPSAIVSKKALIDESVSIGVFSIIHDNVHIKSGTTISAYCEIGIRSSLSSKQPLVIGKNYNIRSHSVFYEPSTFGDKLVTLHRVAVRENTLAGDSFQIETLSDIQGHCQLVDYVRLHSNVHIGQKSNIGNYVWTFPYIVLTNEHHPSTILQGVTVENFSVISPNVVIGQGALIAAHSMVNKKVDEDTVVGGSLAKLLCETSEIKLKKNRNKSVYPWRKHFYRSYPEEIVQQCIN